jgi:hypothetical protein
MAKFLWIGLKKALGWDRVPGGYQDYLENWLPLRSCSYGVKLFAFAMALWTLWNIRNKMAIEGVFVRNPITVFHKLYMLLQGWRVRLKSSEQERRGDEDP